MLYLIVDDLDGFDAWVAAGLDELGAYLGKWAEFDRRYGP